MRSDVVLTGVPPGFGHVLLEGGVLSGIAPYVQDQQGKPEAGGILLGYRRGPHLHIVEATSPGPGDRGTPSRFWRNAASHQRRATQAWKESGRQLDYLGEWHTHPQRRPSPSVIDLAEWAKITAIDPGRPMVFLIAGMSEQSWLGVGSGGRVRGFIFSARCVDEVANGQ